MVNLTDENKEVIRKYYYEMYKLKLEVKDEYNEETYNELKDFVDYKIKSFLSNETKVKEFSNFFKNTYSVKKIKTGTFPMATLIKKAREGNTKSIEYIIRYYQIKYEFNFMLNKDFSEEKIDEGKKEIETVIRIYFDNNMNIKLSTYIKRVINFELDDFLGDFDISDKKREILYRSNYYRAIKRFNYSGILTENEFNNYVFVYLKEKIDKYLEDKEKNELNLSNYVNVLIGRLVSYSSDEEKILIRYNKFFNNKYDETLEFLYNKYNYLLQRELKNNNITSPVKIIKYQNRFKIILEEYLNNKIDGFVYTGEAYIVKNLRNFILEQEKSPSKFNYNLTRNGTEEEKEEQKLIIMEELNYFKEHFKNKYIYFTDNDEVENRINNAFESIVLSYVNGTSTKEPMSYINTRMNQNLELFRKSKETKFIKNDTEHLFAKKCMPMIHNYINNNNLYGDEFIYFIDYCKSAFNYYVNSGSYKEDIKEFMFKVLISYDKSFSKEVSYIKKHL